MFAERWFFESIVIHICKKCLICKQLRAKIEEKIAGNLGRRLPRAKQLINYLYSNPVVGMTEISRQLEMDISTSHRLIKDFENLNILKEKTGFKRNRIFVFEEYLKLFEKNKL